MQNEIFGISLDDEVRQQISQLYKKVRIVFIGSIIWSAINVLSILIRLTALKQMFSYSRNTAQLIIVYSFWILIVIILPIQGYYYYAFSKEIRSSLEEQSSEKFNGSFKLLNTNATLVLLSLLVNFLNILYNMLSPLLY